MNKFTLILIVALVAGWGITFVTLRGSNGEVAAQTRRADSLAAEMAVERLRADGWENRFAQVTDSMGSVLAERDGALATVARELEAARVRIRTLTVAVAEGSGTVVDTVLIEPGVNVFNGQFDDGLLRGDWRLAPPIFTLDYGVRVEQEFIHSVTGDGRWMVTARATDPRVSLSVEDLYVDPPDPVTVRLCPILTRGKWAFFGGIGSLALKELFGG